MHYLHRHHAFPPGVAAQAEIYLITRYTPTQEPQLSLGTRLYLKPLITGAVISDQSPSSRCTFSTQLYSCVPLARLLLIDIVRVLLCNALHEKINSLGAWLRIAHIHEGVWNSMALSPGPIRALPGALQTFRFEVGIHRF
jgi:hypothetical protein